jgi:AcrR family transcriptional regulator
MPPTPAEGVPADGAAGESTVDRRAALVAAALELFARKPYEDVSVDEICGRAGVAHGLLSYHFGGKRGLFAAAIRQAWEDLVSYEKPRATELTAVERVHGFLFRHFEYARQYPERFAIMMRTGHADEKVREVHQAARLDALAEISASLGCPDSAPPELEAALTGWSGYVDAVTMAYLDNLDQLSAEDITDMCAQVLVASVRSAYKLPSDAAAELDALTRVTGGRSSVERQRQRIGAATSADPTGRP